MFLLCGPVVFDLRTGGFRNTALNRRRAASLLMRLMEGEKRWETPDQGVLDQNWGGTEQNRTVTCMVLKAKAT
ncbi:hypothetical protein TNCV_2885231 [Trichonephila clavipes]|nr:hypothetical protein TNCV_2885231 [Trichonephila clavipes]